MREDVPLSSAGRLISKHPWQWTLRYHESRPAGKIFSEKTPRRGQLAKALAVALYARPYL